MPSTKFQKVVFASLTVFITVHLFAYYNIALLKGGMTNQIFIDASNSVWGEIVLAFLLQTFIAGPLSMKLVFRAINPREEKPYIITTGIICATVSLMCPMMTFAITIIHNGVGPEFFAQWFQRIVINFPFAFFTQMFFVQPLVRFLFRTIFKKQLKMHRTHDVNFESGIESLAG